jgi:signal transduction histidine kinase
MKPIDKQYLEEPTAGEQPVPVSRGLSWDLIGGAVMNGLLILDDQRRVVYANRVCGTWLGADPEMELLGKRPGDLFGCVHAADSERGCGSTEFCLQCEALRAIRNGLSGQEDERECRILCRNGEGALDLRVRVTPLDAESARGVLVSFQDIGAEKRRDVLERVFFEDLDRAVREIHSLVALTRDARTQHREEYMNMIHEASERMTETIRAQRLLRSAETGDLPVQSESVFLAPFLQEIRDQCLRSKIGFERRIQCEVDPLASIVTDRLLLRRVVVDMLRNALEASPAWEEVDLKVELADKVRIQVRNLAVMPPEVKRQVFQRSFTTKGEGRGVGTHTMRLLTNRFLNGRISFSSEPGEGTRFMLELPWVLGAPEE